MSRKRARPRPNLTVTLSPVLAHCPECGWPLWADYSNRRTVTTLRGIVRLTLRVRRCPNPLCPRFHLPCRPEGEAHFALPHHEFGLDVLALIGRLRYVEHRSTTEIHHELTRRGLAIAPRTVTNLLDRYDELRALQTADAQRLGPLLRRQKRVVLGLDGLQPHVGHEILWVLRDCLSGEILLARSLLSATIKDLTALLTEVRAAVPVPITGVVSDGQDTIRKAVALALPGVPHQLCHFHYLREAARPIFEADRHAKKELKKRVRGIRLIERKVESQEGLEAEVVSGYCAAVRAALTDDSFPPSVAGLKLQDRLEKIAASLGRVQEKAGQLSGELRKLHSLVQRGLEQTAELWRPVRAAHQWVHRVACVLENKQRRRVRQVRQQLGALVRRIAEAARKASDEAVAEQLRHFVKVTKSWWPGLFRCYQSAEIPRTNNDLEHLFGSHRYHERRASGRKVASPGLVVSGSVRVMSGLATRLRPEEGLRLPVGYVSRWQQLRAELEKRRQSRRQQRRFRRDPVTYLKQLEERALQLGLPS